MSPAFVWRMSWQWRAGSTYAPEGRVLTESGAPVQAPAEESAVLQTATCCALCNDSTLTYNNGALHCSTSKTLLSHVTVMWHLSCKSTLICQPTSHR